MERAPFMNRAETVTAVRHTAGAGLVCNLLLAAAKFIAGFLSASQALIADAVHSLSDLAGDLALIVGVRFWSAPPDRSHPYGHARIETIVSAAMALILLLVGVWIGWNALSSQHDYGGSAQSMGMPALIVSAASILVKEALFQWTRRRARIVRSSALETSAWHHRSDALSSLPVFAAITVAFFFPEWRFVDNAGALIVAAFIVCSAWKLLKPALFELSDTEMSDTAPIRALCLSMPGALDVHAIRSRKTGPGFLLDMHVLVDPETTVLNAHRIAEEIRNRLISSELGIADAVIHIEPYNEAEQQEASAALQ